MDQYLGYLNVISFGLFCFRHDNLWGAYVMKNSNYIFGILLYLLGYNFWYMKTPKGVFGVERQ